MTQLPLVYFVRPLIKQCVRRKHAIKVPAKQLDVFTEHAPDMEFDFRCFPMVQEIDNGIRMTFAIFITLSKPHEISRRTKVLWDDSSKSKRISAEILQGSFLENISPSFSTVRFQTVEQCLPNKIYWMNRLNLHILSKSYCKKFSNFEYNFRSFALLVLQWRNIRYIYFSFLFTCSCFCLLCFCVK